MRLTERKLRRVIRSVITESIEVDEFNEKYSDVYLKIGAANYDLDKETISSTDHHAEIIKVLNNASFQEVANAFVRIGFMHMQFKGNENNLLMCLNRCFEQGHLQAAREWFYLVAEKAGTRY